MLLFLFLPPDLQIIQILDRTLIYVNAKSTMDKVDELKARISALN